MSRLGIIALEKTDGEVLAIKCHHENIYIAGSILVDHYNTTVAVNQLISCGDITVLDESWDKVILNDSRDKSAQQFNSLIDFLNSEIVNNAKNEYTYIFKEKKLSWEIFNFRGSQTLLDLKELVKSLGWKE